ncbi:MAG: cellulase family glycosylhydrolase [Verrucomicrobiales bacterium]|nr:cellulase family glycosylhydrolase [Verrucomicrobiales bacterium]
MDSNKDRSFRCPWVFRWMVAFVGTTTLAFATVAAAAEPLPRGHVFFATDFESTNNLSGWSGSGEIEAGRQSGSVLGLEVADTATSIVSIPLPSESMRGYLVRGSAMVRAENVGTPPQPWNGIKCMLAMETPDRKLWPQAEIGTGTGTFDWRRVAFTARVPTNAVSARLVLGLENVSGKVWFDDVKVSVVKPPVLRSVVPVSGPAYTGRTASRLRGAMISPDIDADGLRVLGRDWGANLIRWQLIQHGRAGQPISDDGYDAWLEGELKKLDAALPLCRELGLTVVIDLHSPPGGKVTSGGYVGSDDRLFTDPACQTKLVRVWERIAARYRGIEPIWGYDLVNEPVDDFVDEGCDDWQALAERVARAVRGIDPERTIIVEPAAWGGPEGLADLVPLPVSNVVYSVHMYQPHAFTHQGVHTAGPSYRYPGVVSGKDWDQAQLEAALRPVVDFQRAYNVHIYIGEFSAIRWAPEGSGARYLSDLIEIFEKHGWDWSYHAFREWSGWSLEHSDDRKDDRPTVQPTERLRVLQRAFARNRATDR